VAGVEGGGLGEGAVLEEVREREAGEGADAEFEEVAAGETFAVSEGFGHVGRLH
jgi:hypothetical protein